MVRAVREQHGYYPDPERPGMLRWWTGNRWLDNWRPGTEAIIHAPSGGVTSSAAPRGVGCFGFVLIVGLIVAALLVGTIVVDSSLNAESQGDPGAASPPDGYAAVTNGVAWRWGDFGQAATECGGLEPCRYLEVLAQTDCPTGLYAEANIIDADTDTVVGYTNQHLGSLANGQAARLEMYVGGTGALRLRTELTRVSCT